MSITLPPPRAPAELKPVRMGSMGWRLRYVHDEWKWRGAGQFENWEPEDYASTDATLYPTEEAALSALAAYTASGNLPKWSEDAP
jgi:hypothetical protein